MESLGYQGEIMQPGLDEAISEMLEKQNKDDLPELLCECEVLLQTNDICLKKLNEHGLKKLFGLVIGIEGRCNCRLRNNFQIIHKITLEVEKKIIARIDAAEKLALEIKKEHEKDDIFMQSCINFLLKKVKDFEEIEKNVTFTDWVLFYVDNYLKYRDTKKILLMVSDIYRITYKKCKVDENDKKKIDSAITRLELSEKKISPGCFAEEILQDSSCLPLYIRDEVNYYSEQSDISNYGYIIYRVYDLVRDPNIQELASARSEDMATLCMPLIKKYIENGDIKEMLCSDILYELLDDMAKRYEMWEQERIQAQKLEENTKEQREELAEKQLNETESRKKYSLLVVSPAGLIESSLNSYFVKGFNPTNDYGIAEKDMEDVKSRIASFSPSVIVKPEGISEQDMGIERNSTVKIISLADIYFCLWYKNCDSDKSKGKIAFLDYYKHKLYVSCYSIDEEGNISKIEPFEIKYTRSRKNIIRDIEQKSGFSEKDISLYRIFEAEKYIDTKLEKADVPIIEESCEKSLKDEEKRTEIIDFLYEFSAIQTK